MPAAPRSGREGGRVKTTPEAKAEELLARHGALLAMDVAHGRLRAQGLR